PVPGVGSKLDFTVDLAAGGVLPVLVTVNNVTTHTYTLDPNDIVLLQSDGTRVPPLALRDAARQGAGAQPAARDHRLPLAAVTQELEVHRFTATTVPPKQHVSGYLYYPVRDYTKGRVVLEDAATEESEGFVVEF